MENNYLIIDEYDNSSPAAYLVDESSSMLLEKLTYPRRHVYLFDLEKIKSVLKEVEVNIKIKNEN